jgi:hypothetical protein
LNFTIRPNTAGAGWAQVEHLRDIPAEVIEVRAGARPKLIDHDVAAKIGLWIEQKGWAPHDAPVFLDPLE